MNDKYRELLEWYTRALYDYLSGAGEEALHRAYELARKAIADGMGLLDMASVHHQAILRVMPRPISSEERTRIVKALEDFLIESLSPFEMTHRAFRESNSALRRLNETLEEEAKRIAHALHDEAGQLLASVFLELDKIAGNAPQETRDELQGVRKLLEQAEEEVRRLSHELRPTMLDDFGLVPALEFLAQGISKRTGTPITVEGFRDGRLAAPVETAVYRIVREALNNVAKHAKANRVRVCVQREPAAVRCSVRDDGVGFDVPAVLEQKGERGFGLVGIRERLDALSGTLQINSAPGWGTELLVTIPLEV